MTIRLANLSGRSVLLNGNRCLDIEKRSNSRFSADPTEAVHQWDALAGWAAGLSDGDFDAACDEAKLGAPVPRAAKVFAIGLTYKSHAAEANLPLPKQPMVFTKFPNCLAGPRASIVLPSTYVDWEVELVVVISCGGRRIPEAKAFDHIAGYCVGQDVSDRMLQFSDTPPQFSMGKSVDGFGPMGPAIVSLDAFKDPNDLALTCDVGDERMQSSRTSDLVFGVPILIEYISKFCTLEPGDLIFTGTPSGVGSAHNPRRYLKPGEVVTSEIEGIGKLVNHCVSEG
jgi:2-keto-4-pentenoate hydratase/2-oxohepta-3-ene-1,7-dioic acid hydratase in catechol pathway